MDIFTQLSPLTQYLGGALATIFVLVNAYDKLFSKRAKMLNNADDRLIGLLKGTVDEQEKRIEQLEKDHKENTRLINTLTGENKALKDILQGRDEGSLRAQERIQELAVQTTQVLTAVQSVLEVSSTTDKHVSDLYELLKQHFDKEHSI